MTLEEFAKKWEHKELPLEVSQPFGVIIAVLEHAGLSKSEIMELAGDVLELSHHLTSTGETKH